MKFKWMVMAGFFAIILGMAPGMDMTGFAAQQDRHLEQQKTEPLQLKVTLQRVYLDGELSEEVVQEISWSPENFWAKYDQWQLITRDGENLVFRKNVDDISPLLKANGYFGITNEGVLTIFNGRPGQSRIIQSFFQIDIRKLESKKQEELLQGIPIKTKDRYVEVLETFRHYSTEAASKN